VAASSPPKKLAAPLPTKYEWGFAKKKEE